MQALELDFVRRRRFSVPGVMLAVAGAAALGAALLEHLEAYEARLRAETRLTRLERQTNAQRRIGSPPRDTDAPAMLALARLRLPWDALLGEIELIGDPAVALLVLEVQGASGTLRLAGEAKGMADAVAYLGRLRASPWIDSAHIVAHEERQNAGIGVVRFTIEAEWSGAP